MKKNTRRAKPPRKTPPVPISTKISPPRNLTPGLCERLRRDMMKACLTVAETHGLTVEGGEMSDLDLRHSFNIGFRVGIPMDDGAIYSPDKAMFEVLASHFGLEPSDYGRTFRSGGDLHRIVGINPNRPKYPISAQNTHGGMISLLGMRPVPYQALDENSGMVANPGRPFDECLRRCSSMALMGLGHRVVE